MKVGACRDGIRAALDAAGVERFRAQEDVPGGDSTLRATALFGGVGPAGPLFDV
jgi:hypothetical protein